MISSSQSKWVTTVTLPPPTLSDNTSDAGRLVEALKKALGTNAVDIDSSLLGELPFLMREWSFRAGCVVIEERGCFLVTGLFRVQGPEGPLGLAVDLGTSRVVLRLIHLMTGEGLAEHSFDNPQLAIGPDILTRIHYAETPEGLATLKTLITITNSK